MIGVCLATVGEYSQVEFDALGCFLIVFGVVLSALKGIVTNMLMVGSLKLHPLDLLYRMAPLAVFQCVIYAAYFGEVDGLRGFIQKTNASKSLAQLLSLSDS